MGRTQQRTNRRRPGTIVPASGGNRARSFLGFDDGRNSAATFSPPDEAGSLEALRQYRILDTASERVFDEVTSLASLLCGASVAFLSFIDKERHWFKSRVGLNVSQVPRSVPLCPPALLHSDLLFVRDTLRDPRFHGRPLTVGSIRLRFYAAAPLRSPDGHTLGALCVGDVVPRALNRQQQQALLALSRQVAAQLEFRRRLVDAECEIVERKQEEASLQRRQQELEDWVRKRTADLAAMTRSLPVEIAERQRVELALRESEDLFRSLSACSPVGIFLTDTDGRCLYSNPRCRDILGFGLMESLGVGWTRAIHPADRQAMLRKWLACMREGREYSHELRTLNSRGEVRWVHVRASNMLSDSAELKGHVATIEDVTERKHAEEALRELSGQLMRLQDKERRHTARELHDATGQKLAALSINLSKLGSADLASEQRRALSDAMALADQCSREIRTLSYLLHPPMLDELGLASAVRWLVEGFAQRSGINVDLDISPSFRRLSAEMELALFRILQESLTNVHRHSGSATARVQLIERDDGVVLDVRDEGRGLSLSKEWIGPRGVVVPGVGIAGMRERVKQLAGTIEVNGAPGKGTSVRVWLPWPEPAPPKFPGEGSQEAGKT